MSSLNSWFKNKIHFKDTSLNFDSHIEAQTQNLLVTYLYKQSVVGQVASLFCALVLFIGLYSTADKCTALIGWFICSLLIALGRVGMSWLYNKQPSYKLKITTWKNLFVVGALLGGISWGFAGSYLFWYATDIQQTLIILIMAGITSGAVPILAADMAAVVSFLVTSLLPLIIQLFFQRHTYVYSLFGITMIAYFVYMIVLAGRAHRLLKQTIGLQFEKEALTQYLNQANERLEISNEKLNLAETQDLLTGLINRKYFMWTLTEAIKRAETSQKNFAVFYMDLDNFKFINDAYGYETGDQVLKEVVKRMRDNLHESDVLARMGGDELAILLENQTQVSNISKVAGQICQLLAKPVTVRDYHINLSASIGVSVYPVDGVLADSLVKKADKAMQYVKEHGRNNVHFSTKSSESSN